MTNAQENLRGLRFALAGPDRDYREAARCSGNLEYLLQAETLSLEQQQELAHLAGCMASTLADLTSGKATVRLDKTTVAVGRLEMPHFGHPV